MRPELDQVPVDAVYAADALSVAELDALPYGMIQLDTRGTILRYSSAETRLSGLEADECVGRNFFDEIAPCTHVHEFFRSLPARRGGAAARRGVHLPLRVPAAEGRARAHVLTRG
jgi:photoactive yellow protein